MNADHIAYLDDLRESGVTNMFGAAPYLEREFGLSRTDARAILKQWMQRPEVPHAHAHTS